MTRTQSETYVTRDIPRIYVLDYGGHLDGVDEAVERIREAPAEWLHVHCDMPYVSRSGSSRLFSLLYPMPWALSCDADRVEQDTAAVRDWVHRAHDAGVQCLFPYICNQTMGGDPDERTGMWWFYDHWDEFAHDVGPKPPVDPIEWQQREPDGRLHFNYPYRFPICTPPIRFAPCPNNPYWHDWLKVNCRLLAEYGYDGVFVDNNIIHCHFEHCQAGFREYLDETFTPEQLRARYGTDDVSTFTLATLGDRVLWACAQPEYRRHLLELDRDVFVEKFGTDDPETAVMSEAGYGYHWGHSNDWWRDTVRREHSPAEAERIFRDGDVSSLGIATTAELCLWVDTQKCRAWSIGARNAELREAGEAVRPGFAMVPNWGDISGFDHTNSRRLDGKNVLLNAPGADMLFYEEAYYPGTLAPGYTFDLMIAYKHAVSCGVRSVTLPYHGSDHRALSELATAEAAAWGGDHTYAAPYSFPDVRSAYAGLFARHDSWFRGMTSHADVGLCFSFDEVHFENVHHYAETSMLARYLADSHVLFDFLGDGQLTLEHLRRYRLVVIPHVQYLSNSARDAIAQYTADGGRVLITGRTGAFDEHARAASLLAADDFPAGSAAYVDDIRDVLPARSWQIHDLMDYHVEFDQLRDEVIPELARAAESESLIDTRLLDLLESLAGRSLSTLARGTPPTLRVAAWRSIDTGSLALHLVNYDAPGPGLPDGPVVPVEDVDVSLTLPTGMAVREISTADAWNTEPVALPFDVKDGVATFRVPRVDAYCVVSIDAR